MPCFFFFLVTPRDYTDKVCKFGINCFFFYFLASAFAFLSAKQIVTQLIVFSEPIDRDVTFCDGISYGELLRGSKY